MNFQQFSEKKDLLTPAPDDRNDLIETKHCLTAILSSMLVIEKEFMAIADILTERFPEDKQWEDTLGENKQEKAANG